MKNKYKLQKTWIWNKTIEDFIRTKIKGYSLNICSGESSLGDIKIDLDVNDRNIIRGDMINLPFNDDTFDTVIQDPPWKIGFYQRMKPFFECVRVCKIGGIIIYNAYWIPTSKEVILKELWIRQDNDWCNTSIISLFTKIDKNSKNIIEMLNTYKKKS